MDGRLFTSSTPPAWEPDAETAAWVTFGETPEESFYSFHSFVPTNIFIPFHSPHVSIQFSSGAGDLWLISTGIMNCYFEYNGSEQPEDHGATGPCAKSTDNSIVQCCDVGDYCLSNGVCQFGKGVTTGQGVSGYYVAGCTDSTFKDPACMTNCTAYANSDVTYDWGSGVWRCCGSGSDGQRNCSAPIGGPMTAPPPQALKTIATIVGTGTMLPLATGPAVLTSGAVAAGAATTAMPDQVSNGGSSISPAVAAGITIGAIVGLLILIAIPVVIIWRRRRQTRPQTQQQYPQISQPIYSPTLTAGTGGGMSQYGPGSVNDHYAQDHQPQKKLPLTPQQGHHELEHSSSTMRPPYPSELGTESRR